MSVIIFSPLWGTVAVPASATSLLVTKFRLNGAVQSETNKISFRIIIALLVFDYQISPLMENNILKKLFFVLLGDTNVEKRQNLLFMLLLVSQKSLVLPF